ncbi:MAG: rhamnogalacturonan acetylesterase [Paludibacter sp.]
MKKHYFKGFLLISLLILLCSGTSRPVHVFMAGDSTMANKVLSKSGTDSVTGQKWEEPFRERGWGMLLPKFFNEKVVIDNLAQNGRSTRTFIQQGWWEKIISNVQKGDYVIIQFAHNNGAKDKPDRYTSPEDYRANLLRFVHEVKAKGGKPIICASIMRRKFDKDGKLLDTHGVYPVISREVAKAEKIPLIDMQKLTTDWLVKEGVDASKQYFHKIPADGSSKLYPKGLDDNTHLNEKGARIVAGFFVAEIKKLHIRPLSSNLIQPIF